MSYQQMCGLGNHHRGEPGERKSKGCTHLNGQVDDLLLVRSAQRAELRRAGYDHICGTRPFVSSRVRFTSRRRHTSSSPSVVRTPSFMTRHCLALNFSFFIYSYATNCSV